jgi:hypothetical protein
MLVKAARDEMPLIAFLLMLFVTQEAAAPEVETSAQLAKVRRIYIDVLTGGDSALQIRDLLVASLQNSKLFIVTEEEEKADATLKGAGKDTVFTDTHQSSEGLNAHTQVGGGSNGSSRTAGRYAGVTIGEHESSRTQERKHEAVATVRLVSKNGDVIWSTTAESLGGKFLGASADVADKIAKRLALDYKAARQQAHPISAAK